MCSLRRALAPATATLRNLKRPKNQCAFCNQTFKHVTGSSPFYRQAENEKFRRPFAFRTASSSASASKADDILLEVLDTEIKFAIESDPYSEEVAPPGSIPFRLEDNPGNQSIVLRRKFRTENIKVDVLSMDINAQGIAGDENVEYSGKPSVALTVTVSKGELDQFLEISCVGTPDELYIGSVSVKDSKHTSKDRMPYVSTLKKNLQKRFRTYLEVRGITPELSGFLAEYMINKESRESTRWLEHVKWFVEKKNIVS